MPTEVGEGIIQYWGRPSPRSKIDADTFYTFLDEAEEQGYRCESFGATEPPRAARDHVHPSPDPDILIVRSNGAWTLFTADAENLEAAEDFLDGNRPHVDRWKTGNLRQESPPSRGHPAYASLRYIKIEDGGL